MAITDRVVELLGGKTQAQAESQAHRAYESGYNDAGEDEPVSSTLKKYGYRRSTTDGLRDFSQIDHDKMLEIVWTIWQSNPIAKRALDIKRDYIIGRGVQFLADDEKLQEILQTFWSINKMDRHIRDFALQLRLFGEQCYPVFVRDTDGQVRIGYVDPGEIERVVVHPENSLEMWAVVVKQQSSSDAWNPNFDKRVYRIIRENEGKLVTAEQAALEDWETEMLKAHGLEEYSGSCFFERVNSVSNQPRGYSDLLQPADWLDQHDETLFALADREQMAGYFSWDVTLVGAKEDRVAERAKKLRAAPPKKGSVNVHNDAEAWQFNYPDIKQAGSIETANELLTFILGGLGLPRHWYGHGDETNRATAQAQGDPTWRSMEHDQGIVQGIILSMLQFVRDQAEIAGHWMSAENSEITVTMPEMTTKDMAAISATISQLVTVFMAAEVQGWITRRTAVEVLAKAISELGVEIDIDKELEAASEELEQQQLIGGQDGNDWLVQHGVLVEGDEQAPSFVIGAQ